MCLLIEKLVNKKVYSPIAQLVERWTVNPCVTGSSPVWGATLRKPLLFSGFFLPIKKLFLYSSVGRAMDCTLYNKQHVSLVRAIPCIELGATLRKPLLFSGFFFAYKKIIPL